VPSAYTTRCTSRISRHSRRIWNRCFHDVPDIPRPTQVGKGVRKPSRGASGPIIRMTIAFDPMADAYDRWYDTPKGKAIFQAELKCLRSLHEKSPGRWLEVGVGTGRFACSLGIAEGIDPSPLRCERRTSPERMNHPVYAMAHFRTAMEIVELAQCAGFALIDAASTLFWKPGEEPPPQPQVKAGIVSEGDR